MALAQLVIEVIGDIAKYQSASEKVAYLAQKSAQQIDNAFSAMKTKALEVGATIVAGLAVDNLWEKFKGATEAAANLAELSEKVGVSVESLSGLSTVATLTHTSMDALTGAFVKMSKSAVDASVGTGKAVEAYRALGISSSELKNSKPDELFLSIATKLNAYGDSMTKTKYLQDIFGKSAYEIAPALKMIGEQGEFVATTTTEQAEAAKKYEQDLIRLNLAWTALWRVISAQLVPVFDALVNAWTGVNKQGGIAQKLAKEMSEDNALRKWAEDAVLAMATLIDYAARVANGVKGMFEVIAGAIQSTPTGIAINAIFNKMITGEGIGDSVKAAVKTAQNSFASGFEHLGDSINGGTPVFDKIQSAIDSMHESMKAHKEEDKEVLNRSDTLGDAELKAQLENRLRTLKRSIEDEKLILTQREQVLSKSYGEDMVSVQSYYDSKADLIRKNTGITTQEFDKEIGLLRQYQGSIDNVQEKIKTQTQIDDAYHNRQKAISESTQQLTLLTMDRAKAMERYSDTVLKLNADLDALAGKGSQDAGALFDASHRGQSRQFAATGDTNSQETLARLRDNSVATAKLTDMTREYDLITKQLSIDEGELGVAQQTGAKDQLEVLAAQDAYRKAAIPQLEAIYARMAATANGPGGTREQILQAAELKLKIDQLRGSSNQLGKTFEDIFQTGFAGFLNDAVNHTKSLKDAFLDMANSISQAITKIAAQNLAAKLFGGGGDSGGGGMASGIGDIFASLFSAKALGGPVAANTPYLVGEQGPELFMPSSSGSIVPNGQFGGGGMTVVQHFAVSGDNSFKSQQQIAQQAFVGAQRAYKRNS